jgi:hypothetical protein
MRQTDRLCNRSVKLRRHDSWVAAELLDMDECRGTQNQPETTYGLN